MSDQKRLAIAAIGAFILLIGAIVATRIDSSKPILNQIVQQIINPTATTTNTIYVSKTENKTARAISAFPGWLNNISAQTSTSTAETSHTWDYFVTTADAFGISCKVASTTVALSDISGAHVSINFDYADCPAGFLPYTYRVVNNSIGAYIHNTNGSEDKVRAVADYWILGNQKPLDIISSMIDALPSSYEREHCVIVQENTDSNEKPVTNPRYKIVPDDALNTLNSKIHPNEVPYLCGDYGLTESPHFFEQVGGALLFISTGQDIAPFDPDSFKS